MEALWLEMLQVKQSYWGRARYGCMFVLLLSLIQKSRPPEDTKLGKRVSTIQDFQYIIFGARFFAESSLTLFTYILTASKGYSGWRSIFRRGLQTARLHVC